MTSMTVFKSIGYIGRIESCTLWCIARSLSLLLLLGDGRKLKQYIGIR